MIEIRDAITIDCTPNAMLDLVMDIERYAQVDPKIHPILWATRDGDTVEFACRPKLAGLRQPKIVQRVRRTPGERIDITLAPPPANRIARTFVQFSASFVVVAQGDQTEVVRELRFDFAPGMGLLAAPLLRRRLPGEVREELERAKAFLERPGPARPS